MRRYTDLPAMESVDDDAMRCGGCAAKVPADVLARVMARLDAPVSDAVAIGLASPDDAALLSFPGAPPLLQTVDFFRAMVDDPYLFGRDRKSTRLNSSHVSISYAVFCLKKKILSIFQYEPYDTLQTCSSRL